MADYPDDLDAFESIQKLASENASDGDLPDPALADAESHAITKSEGLFFCKQMFPTYCRRR